MKRTWLTKAEVLALHDEVLAEFGGLAGVRDVALLESALAKAENLAAYGRRASVFDLAAAYCIGIATNHPSVDGNKRMAFLAAAAFLDVNGYVIEPPEEDVVEKMISVAKGTLKQTGLSRWLKSCARKKSCA